MAAITNSLNIHVQLPIMSGVNISVLCLVCTRNTNTLVTFIADKAVIGN